MTQEKFRKIVDDIKETAGERCSYLIMSFGAMCKCDDSPTVYFDEVDEDGASEWAHDHAAH